MIEQKEKKTSGPQTVKKNPMYSHVQGKLYTSTVAHDLKQYNNVGRANGRPPVMTGKAREVIQKVEYEHMQNCSFKPTITQRPDGSNHGSNQKVTHE